MGEDEPWGFEWTEKREDVRRQLRRHIQGLLGVRQEWQGKESRRRNGDAEQLPPHPRSSPVRSELAAAAQEQLGFSSVIAVASALAPVNEAEDAAELRDCPSCHAPPQDWCSNKATPTEAGQHGGVTTLSGRRSLLWTAPTSWSSATRASEAGNGLALISGTIGFTMCWAPCLMLVIKPGLLKESHLNSHNRWGR